MPERPTVTVPTPDQALGLAAPVQAILDAGWDELVADLGWGLANLHRATGDEWLGLVAVHPEGDEPMVVLWMAGPVARLDDAARAEALAPLEARWSREALTPHDEAEPVPVLVTVEGRPHHVLVDDDPEAILAPDPEADDLDLVATSPADDQPVARVAFSERPVRPTSDHVMVMLVYTALGELVESGLDQAAARTWFLRFAPPAIIEDLDLSDEGDGGLRDATLALLPTAKDHLDPDERVMVVRLLLEAASTDGAPDQAVLDAVIEVARHLEVTVERAEPTTEA